MTDWVIAALSMGRHKYKGADAGSVMKAAGNLFMPGSKTDVDNILDALKKGSLTRRQLQENASRVILMARMLRK